MLRCLNGSVQRHKQWIHSLIQQEFVLPSGFFYISFLTWLQFQIETLASSVRYYKRKCSQQRMLLERSKADSQEIKLLRQYVCNVASFHRVYETVN